MTVSFRYAAVTDLGTVRTNNEDTALATPHLLALADGMGGHAAGEVASAVALRAVLDLVREPPDDDAGPAILAAAARAREALHAMSRADRELEGMGTTLIVLAASDDGTTLAHIGDSRLYRYRDGELAQLTVDHTHVQRLVDNGQLTPAGARAHPYRSMILRSLDDTSDDEPDITRPDIVPGDRLLLCSDGLSDYVADEHLATLIGEGDVERAASALLEAALEMRTRDNVTVLVADVLDGAEPTDGGPAGGRDRDPAGGDSAGGGAGTPDGPAPGVVVGTSLDAAMLSGPARRALSTIFTDIDALPDTLPRSPVPGEAAEGADVAPEGWAPDRAGHDPDGAQSDDPGEPDLAAELLGSAVPRAGTDDEAAPTGGAEAPASDATRDREAVVDADGADPRPPRTAWWITAGAAVIAAAILVWWLWWR